MLKVKGVSSFKIKSLMYFLCILILVMVSSGCTSRLTDFTILSTKSMDISRGAEFVRTEKKVVGEDTKYIIVVFPTGVPNVKESVDKAIESTPGTVALLDGVIEFESFYFPYVFGYQTFRAKGTPLADPKRLNNKTASNQ